jgi:hypothetical protein
VLSDHRRVYLIPQAGAAAMGAQRSSFREDSQVSATAAGMDIFTGRGISNLLTARRALNVIIGELVHLEKDPSNDTWPAATTSFRLLGITARVKLSIRADYKVICKSDGARRGRSDKWRCIRSDFAVYYG